MNQSGFCCIHTLYSISDESLIDCILQRLLFHLSISRMGTGQVTLYIATSVDGYVADEDGSVDWLDEFQSEEGEEAGEFSEFLEGVDCLVMGATTYE
jgi:hypothetical protein